MEEKYICNRANECDNKTCRHKSPHILYNETFGQCDREVKCVKNIRKLKAKCIKFFTQIEFLSKNEMEIK